MAIRELHKVIIDGQKPLTYKSPFGKSELSDRATSVRRFPTLNSAVCYTSMPLTDAVKLSKDVPDCLRICVDNGSMFY